MLSNQRTIKGNPIEYLGVKVLKGFLLAGIFFLSFFQSIQAQNTISVSFRNGAIGTKGNNVRDLSNATNFSTLQITKSYFIQNSSVTSFQVQGNAVTGTLRLVTATNAFVDIPGAMEWSDNGGVKEFVGFIPSTNLSSFNLNAYGGSNYVIDNTKNFALVYNSSSLSFTNGSSITGNSSNPLNALNAYLTSFNASRPTGPVTVTSLSTSSPNPTITGTATLASGETLSIEFNGVVYTTGITRPSATTWSWTVPNTVTLSPGTYNVVAIITNAAGYTLSDATTGELVVSGANLSSLGCITIVASGGVAEGVGASAWTYSNNMIFPNSSTSISINASDVLAKLALGNLTIGASCININNDVTYALNNTNGITFKASDYIVQAANKTVTTKGGNVIFWSDSDGANGGYVWFKPGSAISTTTAADIVVSGGNVSNLTELKTTGNALGSSSVLATGVLLDAVTFNSFGGDITIRGKSATNGGFSISSSDGAAVNANGIRAHGSVTVDSGAGKIALWGYGQGLTSSNGIELSVGTGTSSVFKSTSSQADAITFEGTAVNGSAIDAWGIYMWDKTVIQATNGGGISLTGSAAKNSAVVIPSGSAVLANSGKITIIGKLAGVGFNELVIQGHVGQKSGTAVTSSSSDIEFSGDKIVSSSNTAIVSTGKLTIKPFNTSFTSALSYPLTGTMGGSFTELNLGNSTNTSAITIGSTTTVAGPVTLFGGALAINGALTATNSTINLNATGAVTQTAALTANSLALGGSGTFTLTNPGNNVVTLAAGDNTTSVGNMSFMDASGGLMVAQVGGKSGIWSTGTVTVETLAGDLTLIESVGTTNTTANAIVLNAGKSTAVGTVTGGSILISGSPTVTTGTGGIVKLFSGSDANSTGLTSLVGGTANTRNGVDETTSSFTPALAANGKYALYRTAVQLVAPVITSFTPTTAGNGESVVITGTGFTGVTVVKFGNVNAASFVVNSDTQITAVVGSGASGDVLVQNSAGSHTKTGFIFKVVELKFEGNTLDQTGAGRNGTLVGTATYGPGASGQAICFTNNNVVNGTTVQNYLTLPSNLIRDRGSNFTISLRFKTSTYGAILGYQNAAVGGAKSQWVPILYVQSDGKLNANLWQGSRLNVTSTNRVDDGNWHKVEFSAAPGSITVYIDGVLVDTSTGTIDHLSMSFNQLGAVTTEGLWTGDPIDGWFGFNGCIDEFIILDKSLTASQIQQVTQLPQPTITSFAPTMAKSGETVVITGTNLNSTSAVKLGGVNARSFEVVSATEVRAIVGKNATVSNTIEVTTGGGTATGSIFEFDCTSNALDFDGVNDYVNLGDNIESLIAVTQEAWIYWKGSSQPFSEIFSKEFVSAFSITSDNKLHANFGTGTAWQTGLNSTTSIPLNKWTHVAITRSVNGLVKLYINGVLENTTANLNASGLNALARGIGAKPTSSGIIGYFNGSIDELKVWSSERTQAQIASDLSSEAEGNESGLLAYYNFNQGTAGGTNTSITSLSNLTATLNLNGALTNIAKTGSTSNFVLRQWPVIITQPVATASLCVGQAISVSAVGEQLTYQWYSNSTSSNTGGSAISGATSATFTIPSSATGTKYYYVVVTGACSQSTTSTVSTVTVVDAPVLVYIGTNRFERTFAISPITQTVIGGPIASYSISPALPTGLVLNTTLGVITGTPTVNSTSRTYTVTGTTASGCVATATFTLEVFSATAPSNLSYSPFTQTVRQGTAITPMTPIISGGTPRYSISPALPAGISINATTGIISGTLTAAQTGIVAYRVTASNSGGSSSATVSLIFNTAPTGMALVPATVAENSAAGTTVGTLSTTDADAGDSFTYEFVPGVGSLTNSLFTISGSTLKTAAVFDFETRASYTVRIRVTDAGGLTYERPFSILVSDVNEDNDGDGVKDDEELADDTDKTDPCSFKIASQNATPSDAWKAADCDFDGLTNQKEKELGTDPLKADTDGDGVPDGAEVTDGTDPLDANKFKDSDGDRVPDFVELREGSNSNNPKDFKDSDGDGVPDHVEGIQGSSPTDAASFKDSDGGGTPDYVETILFPIYGLPATSLSNRGDDARDTDGDAVPDYQEILQRTDALCATNFLDTDGDVVPDHVERLENTDPTKANEFKDSDGDGVSNYMQVRSLQLRTLELVVLPWGTKNHLDKLPKSIDVVLWTGESVKLDVVWNKTETVNIFKRGTYELTGTVVIPSCKGYYNPYKLTGLIRVVVQPKPAPRDVTIDNSTFVGSTSVFFIGVGAFQVNDPVDNIHVVSFLGDGYDNKFFSITNNVLYWNSAERAPGKTTFSIVVRVTDRDGNTLDKFFTINRTRLDFNAVTIYNTFTPTGDRFNDTWGVPELRFYEGVRISVYDRGGLRLFYTENPDIRWDGTYNGKEMPVGSYFWVIQIEETGETRRGMLNLTRK